MPLETARKIVHQLGVSTHSGLSTHAFELNNRELPGAGWRGFELLTGRYEWVGGRESWADVPLPKELVSNLRRAIGEFQKQSSPDSQIVEGSKTLDALKETGQIFDHPETPSHFSIRFMTRDESVFERIRDILKPFLTAK